jgi:hypothetical protein
MMKDRTGSTSIIAVAVQLHTFAMKKLFVTLPCLVLAFLTHAQEPVLIGGGSTRPQPVMGYSQPYKVVIKQPRLRQSKPGCIMVASTLATGCDKGYRRTVAQASCWPAYPTSTGFGCYKSYQNSYRASPTVIYFGGGEAAARGYSFRHRR